MGLDLAWLQAFGPTVGLAAVLFVMQARGHLVPKRLHDEVRQDRDTYRQAAETALIAATKATGSVETLTKTVATVVSNSEKQLEQGQRILATLERLTPAPSDRSAA